MSYLDELFGRVRAGFRGIAESEDDDYGRGHAEHHLQTTVAPLKVEIKRVEAELERLRRIEATVLASQDQTPGNPASYQQRVVEWVRKAFGSHIMDHKKERRERFFEEAAEAVQADGMPLADALKLLVYTYDRPAGEIHQEIGGVMVTFAAFAAVHGIDMLEAGETELARINTPKVIEKVRLKNATKPRNSPLPGNAEGAA